MTNIISELVTWVNANLTNYSTVLVDELSESYGSICFRTEPGDSSQMRDLLGNLYGDYQFAVYCKSESKEEAINQITYYIGSLDLNQFPLTDRIEITCEPLTEPHYVSKADNGELIYTASFHIEYYQGV